ncbi:kinase-like domain-containing protein [Polychytrium aggregatum]|uniref:kinase-like domain-containing protein n=1 Tax=Polychytrium aggregatum TaxID=110093 RepID=UPI0022FE5ABA|nr:kinase-like domain-containing protein [Polychytrium aggregatum]KAI9208150.1 kinase-like domain-containing protein [Polychytrium aggregatum]
MEIVGFAGLLHIAPLLLRPAILIAQELYAAIQAVKQNEAAWGELSRESKDALEMLAGCNENHPAFARQVQRLNDFHRQILNYFNQHIKLRSRLELFIYGSQIRQRIQSFHREFGNLQRSIMMALTIGIANRVQHDRTITQAISSDEARDADQLRRFKDQFQQNANAALADMGVQLGNMQEWQIRRLTDAIQTATATVPDAATAGDAQRQIVDSINQVLRLIQSQSAASQSMDLEPWRISALSITDVSAEPILVSGYATTFSAKYHGTAVAMKQLFGTYSESDVKEFRREIRVWKDLNHPHILNLLGACDTEEKLFMISPLLSRGTLETYISDSDYSINMPLQIRWIYQVACGMSYLHANGTVHSDLRTANVSLDDSLNAIITGFGMSKTRNVSMTFRRRRHDTRRERPFHMAPELLGVGVETPTGVSEASDVYAYAILCYEVMNKGYSWIDDAGNHMKAAVQQQTLLRSERPKKIRGLNEDVWQLIQDCWGNDRNERPIFDEILLRLSYFTELQKDEPSRPNTPNRLITDRELQFIQEAVQVPGGMVPRIRQGDPDACVAVTQLLIDAQLDGDDPAWKPAFKLCSAASDSKCLRASFQLAWLYFLGLGVKQDYKSSFSHWTSVRESATDGLKAISTQMLGWSHYLGRGIDFNQNKAIDLMKKSYITEFPFKDAGCFGALAQVNSADAALFYKLCNLGVVSDWLCQHLAAVCLFSGFGVARQQAPALRTIEKLANEQSRDLCQLWLGLWHISETNTNANPATSLTFTQAAVDQGNPWAQNFLGECYEHGRGVQRNVTKAIKCYSDAAAQSNVPALMNMGRCHFDGVGVERDGQMAAFWFDRAVEQGCEEARAKQQQAVSCGW